MTINIVNNNIDKMKTEKELKELLNKYEGWLTAPVIHYLENLVELRWSAIIDYIFDEHRQLLSGLEIYRQISIYNIYNKALKLFKENGFQCNISYNEGYYDGLEVSTSLDDKVIKLFEFDYSEHLNSDNRIPDGYRTTRIGEISLYRTIENKEMREPLLDIPNELSNKEEIEITNRIYNLFLEDYGLTNESFIEEKGLNIGHQKVFVKRQPNLTINNYIKYV